MKTSLPALEAIDRAIVCSRRAGFKDGIVTRCLLLGLAEDAHVQALLEKAGVSPVEFRRKVKGFRRRNSPREVPYSLSGWLCCRSAMGLQATCFPGSTLTLQMCAD